MNSSNQNNQLQFFNDIINSLMYVDTYDLLAERASEILLLLPKVKHVSVIFQLNIIQKIKISDKLISLPLDGNGQIYGKVEIEGENANFATNELIDTIKVISNIVAAVYSRIKKANDNNILATFAKETDYAIVITNPEGKIEWINNGYEKLSGYNIDEVKETKPNFFAQNTDLDQENIKIMKLAIKNQKRIETEIYNYSKSGKKYWVHIEIKPIFENGLLTHYIAVQKDITDLKEVEEKLREAKEIAETANEAKNRFLAITSHEIRTPLNIILGMSKILLETELSETQHKYLSGIKSASQNLLLIINDLLDISKIEAGKLQLESIEFNLKEVMDDAITFQKIKAKEKGIDLILDYDDSISESLIGDPFRLNQILLNLLTNALKFTEKGSVSLLCKLIFETEIENQIQIQIIDTGIGIDQKKIDSIFDSFTQEDISITRKYGGTGLGLTITKQLIDLFNGKISVSSDKTKGTTFTILVSFRKSIKNLTVDSQLDEFKSLKGIKLLLAEDNELNQIIALAYLNRWEIETDTAFNGVEAINMIKGKEYDIILMDIQMPVMDGIKATQIIRNELKMDTPIIALTAHALNEEKEKYMLSGLNDYITKPIDENRLYNAILNQLDISKIDTIENRSNYDENNNTLFNLEELRKISISDNQFIPKILQLFITQTKDVPDKLQQLIENKNQIEIGTTIHQIKPSLNHLSVDSTKDIISKIEQNIHNNTNPEEVYQLAKKMIEILETLFKQLTEELKKY